MNETVWKSLCLEKNFWYRAEGFSHGKNSKVHEKWGITATKIVDLSAKFAMNRRALSKNEKKVEKTV